MFFPQPSIPDDKDGFNNVVEVTEASYKMHNKDLTSTEIKSKKCVGLCAAFLCAKM